MEIPEFIKDIYKKYYSGQEELLATVLTHSEAVAGKAIECALKKNLPVDLQFVREAALLHDIGIVKCHAPAIGCNGDAPYICHGIIGKEILEKEGLYKYAPVCERHTGSGLTAEEIQAQKLPLPIKDMLPLSTEEKLICYADCFFSKSGNLTEEKNIDKIISGLQRHGGNTVERFLQLHELFG